jgi:hypothetical protein
MDRYQDVRLTLWRVCVCITSECDEEEEGEEEEEEEEEELWAQSPHCICRLKPFRVKGVLGETLNHKPLRGVWGKTLNHKPLSPQICAFS